jgi:hypothetical protein
MNFPGWGNRHLEPQPLALPLIFVVLAVFIFMAVETGRALHDHGVLGDVLRAQQPSITEAVKLRQQLQTLAGKTAELASAGDEGAKAVIEQMKAEGVNFGVAKK